MRTTLNVEDDILQAAKELALKEGTTAGKIISQLARKGLHSLAYKMAPRLQNGIPVFPADGDLITWEHVPQLEDGELLG